ncbi:hypothetical protein AMAG_08363 [Allomyces macrogynus ATCC 38327]|uniref:Rho-GAP domain-containing protein n=1 Tax=Allomyces macrogynus (strain ATCC 38327) TaxID=578462 RepID=A0A0L0SLF4_ALLM3|nr:hypothetical protein AMAG_08363 [Allomyces macrogynus ATCC 38327]|eukprot:KNE63215.1 hypothetical protein AMAG_08363 [Allomyces macrogynus ATCC 38327]
MTFQSRIRGLVGGGTHHKEKEKDKDGLSPPVSKKSKEKRGKHGGGGTAASADALGSANADALHPASRSSSSPNVHVHDTAGSSHVYASAASLGVPVSEPAPETAVDYAPVLSDNGSAYSVPLPLPLVATSDSRSHLETTSILSGSRCASLADVMDMRESTSPPPPGSTDLATSPPTSIDVGMHGISPAMLAATPLDHKHHRSGHHGHHHHKESAGGASGSSTSSSSWWSKKVGKTVSKHFGGGGGDRTDRSGASNHAAAAAGSSPAAAAAAVPVDVVPATPSPVPASTSLDEVDGSANGTPSGTNAALLAMTSPAMSPALVVSESPALPASTTPIVAPIATAAASSPVLSSKPGKSKGKFAKWTEKAMGSGKPKSEKHNKHAATTDAMAAAAAAMGPTGLKVIQNWEDYAKKHAKKLDQEDGKVFGRPLQDAVETSMIDPSCPLPAVVIRCIEFLESHGMSEIGLYRIPGSTSAVSKLKGIYDAGLDLDLFFAEPPVDPHAVATLLKLYLRELPHSILGDHLSTFNTIVSTNSPDVVAYLAALARQLPLPNYYLLSWLCAHLSRLAYYSEANKMTLSNLALIFCPTLAVDSQLFVMLVDHPTELFPLNEDGTVPDRVFGVGDQAYDPFADGPNVEEHVPLDDEWVQDVPPSPAVAEVATPPATLTVDPFADPAPSVRSIVVSEHDDASSVTARVGTE